MGSVKYYFGGTKTQQPALILLLHEAFKEEGGGELREPREREPDKIFFQVMMEVRDRGRDLQTTEKQSQHSTSFCSDVCTHMHFLSFALFCFGLH